LLGEVIARLSNHLGLNLAGMRIILVALIIVLDFHKAFVMLALDKLQLELCGRHGKIRHQKR
jgi:hypothetical protein